MSFLHPEFFYYLLPPITLLFIFLLIQKESHEYYFSKDIVDKLRVNSSALTLKTRNNLLFVVGVLIVTSAAEPVLEDGTVRVRATGADILIALDISDSMLATDVYPNRLDLAKKKALELIKRATKYRVGVIAFAKNSYLVSPVSFDTSTVSFLLSKLDTSNITQKGTNILTMLETIAKTNTSTDKKYLLIFSDGGDKTDFSNEIAFANENNIMVFILGMGTELGSSIKKSDGSLIKYQDKIIISKLNDSISKLAIQTGGVYIQNSISSKDIEAMYSEIISNSKYKELKSQEIQRYVALFEYPIILAIFILLTAFSSVSKKEKQNTLASLFIFSTLFLGTSPAVAEMFDFKKLAQAQELYNIQDYNSSAKIYEKYAKKNNNAEAYYNAGNAYYKAKEYAKALSAYSFAALREKELKAKKFSNMGNALVHLDTKNTLERAVKHYEASLRLIEDKLIRENLDAVLKALKESKAKIEEDEKKEDEQEYSEQKTDESGDGSDEADDSNNKNKNKNQEKNKGSNKKNKSDDNKNNKENSNNKNKSNKSKNEEKSNNGSGDDGNDGDAKQQTKELKDKNKNEVKKNKNANAQSSLEDQGMSDLEEDKWVKKLNSKQNTYLYRLNEEMLENDEKNEKPW